MRFREVWHFFLLFALLPSLGRAEHSSLAGADPNPRQKAQDSGELRRDAYDAFLAGIASRTGPLSKKAAEDGDFANKVKASLREIKTRIAPSPIG